MMILHFLISFLGILSFSIIFNMPKSQWFFCSINGAIGWTIYQVLSKYTNDPFASNFFAALSITLLARVLAHRRNVPLTVFTVAGILPLVPGAGIYNTMYMIIINDSAQAAIKGIETLKVAGAIAIAISIIFSLPGNIFKIFNRPTN